MKPHPLSLVGRLSAGKPEGKPNQGTTLADRLAFIVERMAAKDYAGAQDAAKLLQKQATHCQWDDSGNVNC